jgi:hypothetical protein
MKPIYLLICATLLESCTARAADLTGRWIGPASSADNGQEMELLSSRLPTAD